MKVVEVLGATFLLLLPASPVAAQRSLHWSHVRVEARLADDGSLRVTETQSMVFTGDWNGGERRFNIRPRQRLTFEGMRRIEPSGQAQAMREGGENLAVDEYRFIDRQTLRWRSRNPSDAPFSETPITYELTYVLSNVLVKEGDTWILDHDFGFADRPGVIENFSVRLLDPMPAWQPAIPLNGTWAGQNLPPGEGFVVRVPFRYAGTDEPATAGAEPIERLLLAAVALVLLASLARRLYDHERRQGRLDPLPVGEMVDEKWLAQHVFVHLPEVVGAAWDNDTNASEVAAVLARLVAEGRLKSEVSPGSLFKDPVLHLELLVPRDRFHDYERRLVDSLFESGQKTTDTARIRERYKKSGFDPASKIRKPLKDLVRRLVPAGSPARPPSWPSLFAFLLAIALMVVAMSTEPADAPVVIGVGGVIMVCYFMALGGAALWRNRVHNVGPASAMFLVPLGASLAVVLFVVATDLSLASMLALTGLMLLWLAMTNSVLNQARSRENAERIAFRRRLATARAYFAQELTRDQPRLEDAWFPYLIAFGLGKHMDKWFRAFGGESAHGDHMVATSPSSGGGRSGGSGGGWTGFGGGGGFSGGGSSGSWVAAASSIAAGVSAPSSSDGGSGGGGGGGGGSSGGGGGGGW